MTKSKKSLFALSFISGLIMLVAVLSVSFLAFGAEAKPLGEESPKIICTYYDESGNQVDGNALPAGTYTVNFELSGVSTISVIQFTAAYTDVVTVAETPLSLISDTNSELSSMGYILQDGNIVFGFVSNNDTNTAVTTDSVVLASVTATFSQDCDAYDVITVSDNANLTFAEVDYSHGYDDCYGITQEGYTAGTVYQSMSVDVSPAQASSITVSGNVRIANDITGGGSAVGIAGVQIYNGDVLLGESQSGGAFSVEVPVGTTSLTFKGASTISRTVTLTGTADITGAEVPIVICDYNNDEQVDLTDLGVFGIAYSGEYNSFTDFNGDKVVDLTDLGSFGLFYNQTVTYADLALY